MLVEELVCLLAILSSRLCVSALELHVTPDRVHLTVGTRVKIMCQADVPIEQCQFKKVFATSIIDLSKGAATPVNKDYEYFGTGLANGQCGLNLREYTRDHIYDLIGCRVREKNGTWVYNYMAIVINANSSFIYNMAPHQASVVLPGSNFSLLCRADQPLNTCQIKWSSQNWIAVNETTTTTEKYKYNGAGLARGHCGITFMNVTPELSGDVYCSSWTKLKPKGYEADTAVVIVATPPDPPQLSTTSSDFAEGDLLEATCILNNSRPAADMTWLLGGDIVRNDKIDESSPETQWRWSYQPQMITQKYTRTLEAKDNGKELICRGQHPALPSAGTEARKIINVKYAPQVPFNLEFDGFIIGKRGLVTIQVLANPRPKFVWMFDGINTTETDDVSYLGKVKPIRAAQGTDGAWEAKLIVNNLVEEDDNKTISFIVTNELGYQCYNFTIPVNQVQGTDVYVDFNTENNSISLLDEKILAQVQTDPLINEAHRGAGTTIALILLSVIILLLLTTLILYHARTTKRWCYAAWATSHFQRRVCEETKPVEEEDYDNENLNVSYINM